MRIQKTILSVQGRTILDRVYIIKEGSLELFYESEDERTLSGFLQPGEIFGGIYILMNAGLSVRTVQTVGNARLYTLPQNVFLDLCTRYDFFYDFFAEKFRDRMSNEAYASVATSGQIQHFLSRLAPFSFLPDTSSRCRLDANSRRATGLNPSAPHANTGSISCSTIAQTSPAISPPLRNPALMRSPR